ncbi:hypothetical protein [Microbulbifer sp. VAAF005]|uniref:hypothetical protein n=1 Tax=Microbulbifer sp. VAAF005 TaxID=3034230 RepID=UPI0024ADA12C|nr:hypothetical protein [Microbulbifer sp. VAAF005]WHI45685.1 hypothetical protein P0078_18440 [Microbulbifer sp. VAAF005]
MRESKLHEDKKGIFKDYVLRSIPELQQTFNESPDDADFALGSLRQLAISDGLSEQEFLEIVADVQAMPEITDSDFQATVLADLVLDRKDSQGRLIGGDALQQRMKAARQRTLDLNTKQKQEAKLAFIHDWETQVIPAVLSGQMAEPGYDYFGGVIEKGVITGSEADSLLDMINSERLKAGGDTAKHYLLNAFLEGTLNKELPIAAQRWEKSEGTLKAGTLRLAYNHFLRQGDVGMRTFFNALKKNGERYSPLDQVFSGGFAAFDEKIGDPQELAPITKQMLQVLPMAMETGYVGMLPDDTKRKVIAFNEHQLLDETPLQALQRISSTDLTQKQPSVTWDRETIANRDEFLNKKFGEGWFNWTRDLDTDFNTKPVIGLIEREASYLMQMGVSQDRALEIAYNKVEDEFTQVGGVAIRKDEVIRFQQETGKTPEQAFQFLRESYVKQMRGDGVDVEPEDIALFYNPINNDLLAINRKTAMIVRPPIANNAPIANLYDFGRPEVSALMDEYEYTQALAEHDAGDTGRRAAKAFNESFVKPAQAVVGAIGGVVKPVADTVKSGIKRLGLEHSIAAKKADISRNIRLNVDEAVIVRQREEVRELEQQLANLQEG